MRTSHPRVDKPMENLTIRRCEYHLGRLLSQLEVLLTGGGAADAIRRTNVRIEVLQDHHQRLMAAAAATPTTQTIPTEITVPAVEPATVTNDPSTTNIIYWPSFPDAAPNLFPGWVNREAQRFMIDYILNNGDEIDPSYIPMPIRRESYADLPPLEPSG